MFPVRDVLNVAFGKSMRICFAHEGWVVRGFGRGSAEGV